MTPDKFVSQIVAVCGIPNMRANKHVTLDLLVYVHAAPDLIQCYATNGDWYGGHPGLVAVHGIEYSPATRGAYFERFWTAKIANKKNVPWWGFTRNMLTDMAKRRMRLMYPISKDCVVRFLNCARIDPWRGRFMGWLSAEDQLCKRAVRLLFECDHLNDQQWQLVRRELVHHGYCELVSYGLFNKTRTLSGAALTTAYELASDGNIKVGDHLWVSIGNLKPWTLKPQKALKETMIKAVRRAASKARISTQKARAWFKKFNALTVLSRWEKRAIKAEANAI